MLWCKSVYLIQEYFWVCEWKYRLVSSRLAGIYSHQPIRKLSLAGLPLATKRKLKISATCSGPSDGFQHLSPAIGVRNCVIEPRLKTHHLSYTCRTPRRTCPANPPTQRPGFNYLQLDCNNTASPSIEVGWTNRRPLPWVTVISLFTQQGRPRVAMTTISAVFRLQSIPIRHRFRLGSACRRSEGRWGCMVPGGTTDPSSHVPVVALRRREISSEREQIWRVWWDPRDVNLVTRCRDQGGAWCPSTRNYGGIPQICWRGLFGEALLSAPPTGAKVDLATLDGADWIFMLKLGKCPLLLYGIQRCAWLGFPELRISIRLLKEQPKNSE